MKKTFVHIIALLSLATLMLSGCSPSPGVSAGPGNTVTFGDYTFNLPKETYDFKGQTFTIYSYHGQTFEQREDFMRRYALNAQIEALYNVKIKYNLDLGAAKSAAIAGAPVTDFGTVPNSTLAAFVKGGVAEPLNDYLSELHFNDNNIWDETTNRWNNINGKQYCVTMKPRELWKYHDIIPLFMNKNLLSDSGIDPQAIYDMQEKKQWNWDAFAEVTKTITRDLNGDDMPDVYGLSLSNPYLLEGFMASANTNYIKIKDDGSFIFDADTKVAGVIDYLAGLMRSNAARGPAQYTGITDDLTDFMNGKLGFFTSIFASTWISFSQMDYEYGVVCFPIAPGESDYYITNGQLGGWVMFAQPDKARAREIAKFMYVYSTPLYAGDADEKECYWQEANNRIYDEGSKYFLERVFEGTNIIRFNNSTYTGNGLPFVPDEAYMGVKTTKQVIEELTPVCQEFMRTFYS